MKFAWNIHTPQTLHGGIRTALPRYRAIGRPEVYRLRLTAYCAMNKRVAEAAAQRELSKEAGVRLMSELQPLVEIIEECLRWEFVPEAAEGGPTVHTYPDPVPHARVCNLCKGDIFNRAFRVVTKRTAGETPSKKAKHKPGSTGGADCRVGRAENEARLATENEVQLATTVQISGTEYEPPPMASPAPPGVTALEEKRPDSTQKKRKKDKNAPKVPSPHYCCTINVP